MFLSTWLRNRRKTLESWFAQQQTQRQRSIAHPLTRTLLCLERLEDRIAPTIGFQTLYSFTGGNDGRFPQGGVIVDSNGNLDGIAKSGGVSSIGTAFQFNPGSKTLTPLYQFSPISGYPPLSSLIQDSSGNFYGTTATGGPAGYGTVFQLSSDGKTFNTLHSFSFSGTDGAEPWDSLVRDSNGDLFGTTYLGGTAGFGTVFELSPNGLGSYTYTTIHSFTPGLGDGSEPKGGLVLDSKGNLYGTTTAGGTGGAGTLFELSPNGVGGYNSNILYNFTGGNDGSTPVTGLVLDGSGNLYGTTEMGGVGLGGVVFKFNPTTSTFTILHSLASATEGTLVQCNLLLDAKGNLYGAASQGGTNNDGTIFELINGGSSYTFTLLHTFNGADGINADIGLTADSSGNLYGTTDAGGTNAAGTIFELTGALSGGTTTTASNVIVPFSPNAQNVTLNANVSSGSGTVNEGTVTFTILQGGKTIGAATPSTTVSKGQAGVSYALPANLTHGTYTIDAVYNPGPDFTGSSDNTHTLTISPANAVTTANGATVPYSLNSQTLTLSAAVKDSSVPTDTVNEGVVTFTLKQGATTLASIQAGVSAGAASTVYNLAGGQPPGNYTINVSYADGSGNFIDGGDTSAPLVINPAIVATTAGNVTANYSFKAQTLTLSANVADTSVPTDTVGEGIVTFTVKNGGTTMGVVQGAVSKGAASANFSLPAGQLPGKYDIDVSYKDGLGNFSDGGDTSATLTVGPAIVWTTASNASTIFRVSAQTVKLSASVANVSFPTDTVNEGIVTFTVKNGGTTIGSVQSTVNSSGAANAFFSLSAQQAPGNYAIDVGYTDSAGKFFGQLNFNAALTIAPAQVATTAANVSAVYSPNGQTVALSAAVADTSFPTDTVNEGVVTFIVKNGGTTIGTVPGTVSNGAANANFNLAAGQAAGNYTIAVNYSDSTGNFTDNGDTNGTLTLAPANVATTAAASNLTFNTKAQTVTLNATVADNSIPTDTVGAGAVTFTIRNNQIVVGSVSAPVIGGKASTNFNWTPGRAAGSYTIAVSYADRAGNFVDSGDTNNTLTVAPALVTTTAVNASAAYSPNAQNVVLSANVACPSVPIASLDTDIVTFTIKNGSTILGTTQGVVSGGTASANFALPAAQAAGKYTLAVSYSDSHGNFSDGGDTSATLTILPANVTTTANNALVIYPNSKSAMLTAIVADSSNPSDTVNEGTVTFTIESGTTVLGSSVQGTVSNGTASASFSVPTGAAAGAYTLAVSYGDSTGNFSDGGDTSGTFTLLLAPIVTANPSAESVPLGGTAVFTAAANASPTLSVQWQISTDGGKTFTNIGGATTTTLTLSNVQASQNGNEYQVVFTNSYGTATTSAATLTVPFAPTVTTNPSNQTTAAGQNVTFTAAASGSPAPTLQWQVSTDGGKTFTNLSGATSGTLKLSSVQASQNGYEYQAVFTNSIGTAATSAATLTVQYAPTVASNPSNQTATVGQEVAFTAAANGNPAPTVQWQVSTDNGATFSNISGAITPTLTLAGLTTAMSGYQYQAVFTNKIGSVTTSAATLTVNPAVLPVITGNPASQTVSAGTTVSFTVSSNGGPTATVQWQVSSDGGATFTNINGATSTTLTLIGVTPAMNGFKYQAVFSNSGGSAASVPVTLTVHSSSSSTTQSLVLNVPPLLALLDKLLGGIETVNANGTETIVDSLFGIALVVSTYDSSGNFLGATLLGFSVPNWVWNL